jgi:thiol-disulfide isomerase/thioredoxin
MHRPARRRLARAGAATALVLGGGMLTGSLAACSPDTGQSVAGQGYIAGQGTIAELAADERDDPVELSGRTLDGERFDVADHRGEVVVVNVWGSWCPPCIAEAPALQQVWEQTEANGVQFVGIDFRDNVDSARAHEKRFGTTYPSIDDPSGETLLRLRGTLPARAIPSTLVLDRRGRVAARVLGQVRASTLRALVSDALAERRA